VLSFLTRLMAAEPEPLDDSDARLALAALMVRLAKSDGQYDAREESAIAGILKSRFELDDAATQTLRESAEDIEAAAPDTVRFTRAIKEAVAYEERTQIVESLWAVVLADGRRDDDENALMRLIVGLLGVTDQASALARQRVAAKNP